MQESGENYLETILILSRQLDVVRSIDVANELGYAKPSISRAMAILRRSGYLEMDRHGRADAHRGRAVQGAGHLRAAPPDRPVS